MLIFNERCLEFTRRTYKIPTARVIQLCIGTIPPQRPDWQYLVRERARNIVVTITEHDDIVAFDSGLGERSRNKTGLGVRLIQSRADDTPDILTQSQQFRHLLRVMFGF